MESTHNDHKPLAGEIVPEITREIIVPDEVARTAQLFADVIDKPTIEWAFTRASNRIATACVYLADSLIRGAESHTQEKLAEIGNSSHVTIRKYRGEIPQVFLEHATDDEKDALPTAAESDYLEYDLLDMLRVYSDAERAGIGIRNIDPHSADPGAVRDLAGSIATFQQNN